MCYTVNLDIITCRMFLFLQKMQEAVITIIKIHIKKKKYHDLVLFLSKMAE